MNQNLPSLRDVHYQLQIPVIFEVAFAKLTRAILTVERVPGRTFPTDWDVDDPSFGFGYIQVNIEFADRGPDKGRMYFGQWCTPVGTHFPWPAKGYPLPILIGFKPECVDGRRASRMVSIETADGLAALK